MMVTRPDPLAGGLGSHGPSHGVRVPWQQVRRRGGEIRENTMTIGTQIDYDAIKKTQRAGWETGDYPRVGNTLQIMAELLVEAADVRAGQEILDVASGQGNAALAAARRFARATGGDYALNLLEQG